MGPKPRWAIHVDQVQRSSGVVLVDRIVRKRGALGRGSALPLTGRRAEAVLVLPLSVGSQIPSTRAQGARQRASEAGSRPSLPADNAGKRERCSEGSRSRARRAEQAELLGRPGTIVQSMLKLEARRQAKLHSIMLSAKVSAGRAAWKPSSPAKADGGGDSRVERSAECSCCKSVADAG